MKIIAEVGSNWLKEGSNQGEHLFNSVQMASQSGADIFKVQLFRAETLYSKDRMPEVYDRVKKYELSLDWLVTCRSFVNSNGMKFWASVFDANILYKASEFLQGIKIASGDLTNYPLIRAAAKVSNRRGIPLAISTGAATYEEIRASLAEINSFGPAYQLILFHCVSAYPADPLDINLLSGIIHKNNPEVDTLGFSDHTMTSEAAKLALAMGYNYFEKHFHAWGTPDESPDRVVSVSPEAFRDYVYDLRRAEKIIGEPVKRVMPSEVGERRYARRGDDGLRPIK